MAEKLKILIVDDEKEIIENLTELLEYNNFTVSAAYDGAEALSKARREEPDIVLLDIMLPKMDGYKVCKFIKADMRYKHIPIILFSAYQTDKVICDAAGCDAFIPKPFDPETLLNLIANVLAGEKRKAAAH